MKKRKNYSRAKQLCFKPEINLCPHCNQPLKRSHIAWHKNIFTLNQTLHITSYAYKCKNKTCQNTNTYRSTEAEKLSIKYYQYGIDIITKIGHLYFQNHQTIDQIKQTLTNQHKHLQISRSETIPPNPNIPSTNQSRHKTKPHPSKQNQNQRRNSTRLRWRSTRKRQPNPMDPKRPHNPNNTFSKKPRHRR